MSPYPDEPEPSGWPGEIPLDDVIRGLMPTPEEYAEQAQQLRDEQYAKAGLPLPGDATKGVMGRLLGQDPGKMTAEMLADWGTPIPQAELVTELDRLLSNTVHAPYCEIGPDDTNCYCLISAVRAVMPICGHVRYADVLHTKAWKCFRHSHPSQPDSHNYWVVES